jgi:hypothetical protein
MGGEDTSGIFERDPFEFVRENRKVQAIGSRSTPSLQISTRALPEMVGIDGRHCGRFDREFGEWNKPSMWTLIGRLTMAFAFPAFDTRVSRLAPTSSRKARSDGRKDEA